MPGDSTPKNKNNDSVDSGQKQREPFAFVTNKNKVVSRNVFEQYATKDSGEGGTSESRQIPQDKFKPSYRKNNLVEPLYNPSALARLTEVNPYHQRCVTTKAQDIAGNGWELKPVEEKEGDPSQEGRERALNFFESQWPPFTATLTRAETDYQSIGFMFLECVRENHQHDQPYEKVYHVPAHTIRVHEDQDRFCQIKSGKKAKIWFKRAGLEKDVHYETGEIYELGELAPQNRASELIYVYDYSSRSDYYGIPSILPSLGAIQGYVSQRDYNIKFFENFGIPAYAVYVSGNYELGEDDETTGEPAVIRKIREHLDKVQTEPHSTLVFGIPSRDGEGKVEITFEPLAVNTKDASFRMYRKDNRDEIIVAHGVPPYRIGIAETGSLGGSTAEESTDIYLTSVVQTGQSRIESYINRYIMRMSLEVTDWIFKLNSLDTSDEEHDLGILVDMFKVGSASPNDIVRNMGGRFGIDVKDHPALNARYINGKPITNLEYFQEEDNEDVEATLQSLQNKLMDIAKKSEEKKRRLPGERYRGKDITDLGDLENGNSNGNGTSSRQVEEESETE